MGECGKLAVTARGDGSRWYGRISIPESVAKAAGIAPGAKIAARRGKSELLIQANDSGRIKFPAVTGKSSRMHAFEASTTTLGLREAQTSQITTRLEATPGLIRISIPAEMFAHEIKQKKMKNLPARPLQNEARPLSVEYPFPIRTMGLGTVSTLLTEANRAGKVVRPVSLGRAIEMLRENGHEIQQIGARLFRIDGRSASLPELSETLSAETNSNEHDKIVIVLD